ncbi:glycosyltransferase involved in cell wall biosynthesis [Mesoflavibacter sabulilitoris]|uniref:Glycosyl transferase n=1 Tax=Mesoflavibacter zeaxanthinifaciens subsp. sabulilitoris TaxID=1520893 RepID=A0A2T1NB28_9FLAO|nr:glycosyltransferase [Mesoflavibacter zeaxanthinifaciens]MBB3123522.1 glycosyltransferase involved in cell wall biosynthesis [Mesoflavibacter zeaxanthinifaciens subsp. sabulilitoris]PSG89347.1 glycosyl transferase [Mesoflavibacter zeaxanthinifaciens subsp. sabulilitoris]
MSKFLIISHVSHKYQNKSWYGYAPYVREMNIWLKYVNELTIVAPISQDLPTAIDLAYQHDSIVVKPIPKIAFVNLKRVLTSLFAMPVIIFKLFLACKRADHIHLRCPGNIGLLGCLVQLFFPKKIKTAKYAGNWDPNSKQPLSYRLQKWLLSNTSLTRNMTALVYGDWPNQTKNIKSFFTATFTEAEKEPLKVRDYSGTLEFIFVGSLVEGKRPLFAIQLIEQLLDNGQEVRLHIFGDGVLRSELEHYIKTHQLESHIVLHGNQPKDVIKTYYETSHFLILASKSEGWPKVVAEAMFFGVIPLSTRVSCVPTMLGHGQRGILIEADLDQAVKVFNSYTEANFKSMSIQALEWSQAYTLDRFDREIRDLILFEENRE